ncbi:C-C motif chemokine 4-like isoform X2 [Sphaerodactylus townsendi]|nr:C-C motif chemokine 4-like isoform X2 [Sphaerodactylus townsendi]XP_048374730.1 C-C motif chemokine 4-like isoform X2 [Sphaerodactylus townsendi]XP_048374731.1 C-C motif chemokine 4-like isoform X2 [Sphaerodactylus townsendi]
MKVYASACTLALLLLLALCSQTFGSPVAGDPPTSCCFSYVARKIPRNLLKDYYETSSKCSQPGVVFTTKKGKYICANPKEQWVQDHMNYLDTKPAVSE